MSTEVQETTVEDTGKKVCISIRASRGNDT